MPRKRGVAMFYEFHTVALFFFSRIILVHRLIRVTYSFRGERKRGKGKANSSLGGRYLVTGNTGVAVNR